MKIRGEIIKGANRETIVIPRGEMSIIFIAEAVLDTTEFNTLCPAPIPRTIIKKGGAKELDTKDAGYKADVEQYNKQLFAWTILKSLEATEGLEWETVRMDDPSTWLAYSDELKASGFSTPEVGRIINGVLIANCLDEAKIEAARNSFLSGEQQVEESKS